MRLYYSYHSNSLFTAFIIFSLIIFKYTFGFTDIEKYIQEHLHYEFMNEKTKRSVQLHIEFVNHSPFGISRAVDLLQSI